MLRFTAKTPMLIFSALTCFSQLALSVTWEEQAQRLQEVSATFLDGFPVAEPIRKNLSMGAKTVVSFLPKMNPQVGAKSEDVPHAPVHTVPQLLLAAKYPVFSGLDLGMQVFGGYLVPGAESLVNLDASLSQKQWGASLMVRWLGGSFDIYMPLGWQSSEAELKGAITTKDADDRFTANSQLIFAAIGTQHRSSGLWMNILTAYKRTKGEFEIESDATTLKLDDDLSEAELPLAFQATLGLDIPASNLRLGLSELYVPSRVLMPRLYLAYEVEL